jgi:hypothetical protein
LAGRWELIAAARNHNNADEKQRVNVALIALRNDGRSCDSFVLPIAESLEHNGRLIAAHAGTQGGAFDLYGKGDLRLEAHLCGSLTADKSAV